MGFGSDANNIEISVTVDAKGTIKVFDQLGNELDRVETKSKKADQGFSKLQANLVTLNQATQLAQTALRGLTNASTALFNALDRAAKVEALAAGFENLQSSIGNLANDKMEALKKQTRGLVSEMDLMQSANQAVLLGVDDGSGKFEELTGAALKLGRAMGIDAKSAVDSLTIGIGRQQPLILDNLGVTLKAGDAYKKFAAEIGKTTEQLTDNERKLAFNRAAVEAIEKRVANLAEIEETAAVATTGLKVTWSDLTAEFVTNLSSSEALKKSIDDLDRALKEIDTEQLIAALAEIASWLVEIVTQAAKAAQALSFLGRKAREHSFKRFGEDAKTAARGIESLDLFAKRTAGNLDKLKTQVEFLRQKIVENGFSTEQANGYLEGYLKTIKAWELELKGATKTVPLLNMEQSKLNETIDKSTEKTKKLTEAQKEEIAVLDELSRIELEQFRQKTEQVGEAWGALLEMFGMTGNAAASGANFLQGMFPETGEFLSGNMGQVGLVALEVFIKGFAGASAAYENRDKLHDTGVQIGQDVYEGWLSGIFGEDLGELFTDIEKGIGIDIGGMLGKLGLFGSNDPQAVFRSGAADWFADLFKGGIKFGFEEGVKELKSLDFSKYTDQLGGLSDADFQGFAGIGDAFAAMFEDSFEGFGGQLANIFAGNLEDLNNLQIMLKMTGVSAEDLQAAIEQAYLMGDVTAGEFLRASRGIQDVYADGIPGAIGATGEAMQNLITGGLESGAIAFDALGDIAAEAAEKGIENLDQLRADLIASGHSVESVDQLFQALADNGISSIEDLADISVEQTAGVVDALEKMGFAFDEPVEKADALLKTLQEIEHTDPTAHVTVTADIDPGLMKLLDADLLPNTKSASGGPQIPGLGSMSSGASGGSFYGGGASGGDKDARQEARQRRREFIEDLNSLVSKSDEYKRVLEEVARGTYSNVEAGGLLKALYGEGRDVLKEYEKAERKYEKALMNRNGKTEKQFGRIAKRYADAKRAMEDLGKIADGNGGTKSTNELMAEIVERFKSGSIGAGEARDQLADLMKGAGQGLPGVGDVTGALDMLMGATTGSDQIAALKNLAIEAKEKGLSLGEVEIMLRESGFAGEQALMTALGQGGIDSLDDLLKISDQAAINLIATLHDLEFPFRRAEDAIDDIIHKLDSIPRNKTITVDVIYNDQSGNLDTRPFVGKKTQTPGLGQARRAARLDAR